jgi:hypothetical protein
MQTMILFSDQRVMAEKGKSFNKLPNMDMKVGLTPSLLLAS